MRFFSILGLILLNTCSGFSSSPSSGEIDLSDFECQRYSQNGEDGIIEKIFSEIGTSSKFCVEFGAYDGVTCSNTLNLRKSAGWTGLLLDEGFENTAINLHKEFITKDNINQLFAKYLVPPNVDLISIDIDFNDFYVWKELDQKYKPRLVVIEYNATHLSNEDKVVHYNSTTCRGWDGTNYFGASIKAFYNLGQKKGYSLVYADKQGVNLFFVRNDLVARCPVHFKNINNVQKLYRKPNYGPGPNGGHSQDPLNRPYVTSEALLKKLR